MENKIDVGYEVGKWYLVEIDYGVFVPGKFIGVQPCSKEANFGHNFPHPGEAIFENTKTGGFEKCGYSGICWDEIKKRFTDCKPVYRLVTENELWAVRAIEEFQKMIAGRKNSFKIELPNGCVFQGKIGHLNKKDDLPGTYFAKIINKKTSEKKEGIFSYKKESVSVKQLISNKFPGWEIIELKLVKKTLLPELKK